MPSRRPDISFVIPVYNDAPGLPDLYARLTAAVDPITRHIEILLIDDRSEDDSFDAARRIADSDPRVRAVRFTRNFGHHAALMAGFHLAEGEVVVTLDGDGQNDPADIPKLLEKIGEGCEIVFSVRQGRTDSRALRQLPSAVVNRIITRLMGVNLSDVSCNLKAWRRNAVLEARRYGALPQINPVLHKFKIAEVPVADRPRAHGQSQHGPWRLIRHGFYLISCSLGPRVYKIGALVAAAGLLHWLVALAGLFSFLRPLKSHAALTYLLAADGFLFLLIGLMVLHFQKTLDVEGAKPNYAIEEVYCGKHGS